MLRMLFQWLDANAWFYWTILGAAATWLLAETVSGCWTRPTAASAEPRREWSYPVTVVAFLFAGRWPFLFEAKEFNPDEGQFIAGARTLLHDPVFWRSVDGVTSGPLNFFALVPLRLLGLPLDYFTARLVGLVLVATALIACYRLLRSHAPAGAARLALLPAVVFFATVTDDNFVHYSSEHVSLALFGLAALALYRKREDDTHTLRDLCVGGVLAGLLPWAKLQFGPLAAVLVAGRFVPIALTRSLETKRKLRLLKGLTVSTLVPTAFWLCAIVVTGQFEHFVRNYIVQNFVYVSAGQTAASTVRQLVQFASRTMYFPAFVLSIAAGLLLCGYAYVRGQRRPGALFVIAILLTGTAIFSIWAAHYPWVHYLLLAVLPLTLLLGAAVTDVWPGLKWPRAFGCGLLAVGFVGPFAFRATRPAPETIGRLTESWRHPYSVPGAILRKYTQAGDMLAVWGWRTDLYVDSGMPQAVRDPHTAWSIWDLPNREYYRARFLSDLRQNQPAFFVDAVGPGATFFQNRTTEGHESYPALADYIQRNYFLLVDLQSERIYARWNSHVAQRGPLAAAQLPRLVHNARDNSGIYLPDLVSVEPATLGKWDLDGRSVQMLLPPARMAWRLNGDERQVTVEFGFHPRAYTEGHSNGANLYVEVDRPGSPVLTLYRRHLDPARVPSDRGLQVARVLLPPMPAGSHVVVRSDPGEYGDQAWDWVYVASLKASLVPIDSDSR